MVTSLRSKWAAGPAAADARQHKGAGVGRPLTGRARVLARRKEVPSSQTYSDHSTDKHARPREQRIAGTRSLPAPGPARARHVPGSWRAKATLFMGQDTRLLV